MARVSPPRPAKHAWAEARRAYPKRVTSAPQTLQGVVVVLSQQAFDRAVAAHKGRAGLGSTYPRFKRAYADALKAVLRQEMGNSPIRQTKALAEILDWIKGSPNYRTLFRQGVDVMHAFLLARRGQRIASDEHKEWREEAKRYRDVAEAAEKILAFLRSTDDELHLPLSVSPPFYPELRKFLARLAETWRATAENLEGKYPPRRPGKPKSGAGSDAARRYLRNAGLRDRAAWAFVSAVR